MTIYGIHAYIIFMNWSYYSIALGYDYYMMNIIQQIADPMPTIFLHIDLAKLLLLLLLLRLLQNYCYYCTCYKTIVTIALATKLLLPLLPLPLLLLLLSKLSYYFSTDHFASDN